APSGGGAKLWAMLNQRLRGPLSSTPRRQPGEAANERAPTQPPTDRPRVPRSPNRSGAQPRGPSPHQAIGERSYSPASARRFLPDGEKGCAPRCRPVGEASDASAAPVSTTRGVSHAWLVGPAPV